MIAEILFGQIKLSFSAGDLPRVLSVFSTLDVPFNKLLKEDDCAFAYVPLYRKKQIVSTLKSLGITATLGQITGVPSVFYRYRKRIGIPLGLLVSIILIWLSGKIIWCVNVEGNYNVPDSVIIDLLSDLGCGVGDTYENIDFDMLHNRFLMECEGISWIAVNMNGTHANVEVREVMDVKENADEGFYNIVASENGQIERLAATEGKPVVEIFDTVEEGDLLISGAISYKEDTKTRFESADGSVFARVNRSFEINVPIKQEIMCDTGATIEKNKLRFFKLNINLFRNSGIPYEFYDKITVTNQIYLFESIPLPVFINKTVYKEKKYRKLMLTEEQAKERACLLYKEKLISVIGDAEMISKTVTESFSGDVYTVRCELYCLADIARKVPLVLIEDGDSK